MTHARNYKKYEFAVFEQNCDSKGYPPYMSFFYIRMKTNKKASANVV